MKHCSDILVGADGNLITSKWPECIIVDRGIIESPPPFVRAGRKGTLTIELKNGRAVYWRTGDVPAGWTYRLLESVRHPST